MKTLNKIILTSLIGAGSLGIFEKGYGQNTNLDNLLKQMNAQIKKRESIFNESDGQFNDILNQMKAHSPEYFSEKVYSENLCINLNEKIYHVTKKNEEEGVNDLIKICNKDYEEAWLYLPEKQKWYEIGIHSDSVSVKPFMLRIEEALEENKDVKKLIFYHNHPGEVSGDPRPSILDFNVLNDQSRIFSDYKIVSKIITKSNIVEFYLNSKGKEKLLEDQDWIFKGVFITMEYWGDKGYDKLSEYFDIKCTQNKITE